MSVQNQDGEELFGEREESAENTEIRKEPVNLFGEPDPNPQKDKKEKKKISVAAFVITCISLVLAAVMFTYTICMGAFRQRLAEEQLAQAKYYPFELFQAFLSDFSMQEMDEKTMIEAALKAYVAATGDRYAAYYTAEEYAMMTESNAGDSEGIGINVINDEVSVGGQSYRAFRVINVSENSPAGEAGVQIGDMVYAVGLGEDAELVSELGYDVALAKLKGEAGTDACFSALRPTEDGYETLEFTVTRGKVITTSVYYHVSAQDPTVGIVKIIQFDLTTPTQFTKAMDTLLEEGCEKFVFDVRYNPGGDLRSIEAVLSYFLEEGDVIIRMVDATGAEQISRVGAVEYGGIYASCSVSESDIGKYRGLDAVVLCNESTASAAELFSATMRDYDLAPLVGMTTFGKGCMQSVFDLTLYGYSGALKFTTAMYYAAKSESYHDVGIVPDVEVELNEEAAKKNIYVLTDEEDNQLQTALAQLGVRT